MKCPKCNKELNAGFKFCPYCGTTIPQANTCPECGATNLPPDCRFCPDCGAKLIPQRGSAKGDVIEFNVAGVSFKMVHVEAGEFIMGGFNTYDNESPIHRVTLSNNFYIGQTQVTQGLWEIAMSKNPSNNRGRNKAVEQVSWNDCKEFIERLNSLTGKTFRLPTEAEWEFVARGGNKSKHYQYSGSNNLGDVAWYDGNSDGEHHEVAGKHPNELGIYDMSGNVWEWCEDRYGVYSSSHQINPTGPTRGGVPCYSRR